MTGKGYFEVKGVYRGKFARFLGRHVPLSWAARHGMAPPKRPNRPWKKRAFLPVSEQIYSVSATPTNARRPSSAGPSDVLDPSRFLWYYVSMYSCRKGACA